MKKLILVLFFISLSFSNVSALTFQETPADQMEISARTVFLNYGAGGSRASLGLCRTGPFQMVSSKGEIIFNFLQPCVFGSTALKKSEDITAQFGLGLIEVMEVLSFNGVLDSKVGGMYWGVGISLNFDDSFSLFE